MQKYKEKKQVKRLQCTRWESYLPRPPLPLLWFIYFEQSLLTVFQWISTASFYSICNMIEGTQHGSPALNIPHGLIAYRTMHNRLYHIELLEKYICKQGYQSSAEDVPLAKLWSHKEFVLIFFHVGHNIHDYITYKYLWPLHVYWGWGPFNNGC